MIRTVATCLATMLLATAGLAQAPCTYPDASTANTSGNNIALGMSLSNTLLDEGAIQMIVPARFLPSVPGAPLTGIELLAQSSQRVVYTSLEIRLGQLPAGSVLSPTFAQNLPNPTLVFQAPRGFGIAHTSGQWSGVMFQTPFVHDGRGDVVVEFRKIVDRLASGTGFSTHAVDSDPGRAGLPVQRWVFGAGTSVATAARHWGAPSKLRLLAPGVPTVELASRLGGASNQLFAVGTAVQVAIHAPAYQSWGAVVCLGDLWRPATVPGIAGLLYVDPALGAALGGGLVPAAGTATTPLPIPQLTALVGLRVGVQGVAVVPPVGLMFATAPDFVINS